MAAGTPCSVTALPSLPPAYSISLFIQSPRGRNVSLELLPEPSPEPPSPCTSPGQVQSVFTVRTCHCVTNLLKY